MKAAEGSHRSDQLSISLFGGFALHFGGRRIDLRMRKAEALLAYLVLSPALAQTRDQIIGLFWSEMDETHARASLRQLLTTLRSQFHELGFAGFSADRLAVSLDAASIISDVLSALVSIDAGRPDDLLLDRPNIAESIMAGYDNVDPAFHDWLVEQRQHIAAQMVRRLEEQLDNTAHDARQTKRIAETLILMEPTHEGASQSLMRCYADVGDLAGALAVYKKLWDLLAEEHDMEPSDQTQELVAALKAGTYRVSSRATEARVRNDWQLVGMQHAVPLGDVLEQQRTTTAAKIESLPFETPLQQPLGRPSIAVLPFRNLGPNAIDDYFAQGLAEDIVISLAGLRDLFVISRNSTIALSGTSEDVQNIGRTLGVRYVLTGTVRRHGERSRVSALLRDTDSGTALWAETVDVSPTELFDFQDQIVEKVVAGIAPNVARVELERSLRKRPENFSAYDYTLQALHLIFRLDKEEFYKARELLDKAIAEDPHYAMPFAWAARWHNLRFGQGWSTDIEGDNSAALRLAATAVQLEPNNALGLATYGHLQAFLRRDHDFARLYIDKAIAASPSSPIVWALGSITSSYVGEPAEAVQRALNAIRLSPLDRSSFYFHGVLGLAHYVGADYDNAVKWTRISASENPQFTANLRFLAAALAASGRKSDAREVVAKLLSMEPTFTLTNYRAGRLAFKEAELRQRYLRHLQLAGFKG
jgi:TolB-like protein/DNA-binding SARP family transcriptional activator